MADTIEKDKALTVRKPSTGVAPSGVDEHVERFKAAETTADTIEALQARADDLRAVDRSKPRRVDDFVLGHVYHQGDVSVSMMRRPSKVGKPMGENGSHAQVAVGEGVGARHLVPTDKCAVRESSPGSNDLIGPWIEASQRFILSHPEHQDISLPESPDGCGYQISYQRQFAEELRRARD